jgi:putative endonuclease
MNYVYILECGDGTYYTGWTTDLKKREQTHNSGKGAKYTRSRLPVKVIYFEEFATSAEAHKREWALKRLTRKEKENLVKGFAPQKL